jgi:hypothetical protein
MHGLGNSGAPALVRSIVKEPAFFGLRRFFTVQNPGKPFADQTPAPDQKNETAEKQTGRQKYKNLQGEKITVLEKSI